MPKSIFSKIIDGEIPGKFIYQDGAVVAFHDVNPAAPFHVLIVPREPLVNANDLTTENIALIGKMFLAARQIAAEQGLVDGGYRLVMNNGAGAGQSVFHMHLHMLAGRPFAWPPG
jgi:histidine triad (HIT) family protein